MTGLFRILPPPSPDTSGFCSVLMRTDGAGILDDPQGCATNYIGSEEADYELETRVFASQMSDMDVIFGSQRRLLERFREKAAELKPKFVLFGGSPVTALIGTDLCAAAGESTAAFGIPCGSVELNGHDTYEVGISKTLLALGALFLKETGKTIPGSVNLLGLNAIDLGVQTTKRLPELLTKEGMRVLSVWGGETTVDGMKLAVRAERNIVLTVSGLPLAEFMQDRYGIPYTVGLFSETQTVEEDGAPVRAERVLIMGEQVSSNSLRGLLGREFGFREIRVASLFTMCERYLKPGDLQLRSEEDIRELLREGGYDLCICDPLYVPLAPEGLKILPLPHPAVSGKRFEAQCPLFTKSGLLQWLYGTKITEHGEIR